MNKSDYNDPRPVKIDFETLTERQKYLLTESKTFCIYPWIHMHAYPTGEAHPCCHSTMWQSVGHCKKNSMQEIWNQAPMRALRKNMLEEKPSAGCVRCYEQEKTGFMSGRQAANKHHGHHISRVDETDSTGNLNRFEMTYWDVRFSNLCNLRCRSCGFIFSSSWYADQVKLAGDDWGKKFTAMNYAGRTETDMWEQLLPHIDHVEQVYFAGGEPLMMEEHYNILEELESRGRFDVRLIYNTNFTHTKLKNRSVFDYWRRFESVSVGASLDAMGPRAEYIRKGTDWDAVERNRERMLEVCPQVDFYISPTLSLMNAWHLPDFHRDWVDRGLIRAQDLNVNILQDPPQYRIDVASARYKDILRQKYQEHIEWLQPLDPFKRACQGFESAITFMDSRDNSDKLPEFWTKAEQLDKIRGEDIRKILPELEWL